MILQERIDSGGMVEITGYHEIDQPLRLPSNAYLYGNGHIVYRGGGSMVEIVGAERVRITDLQFSSVNGGGFYCNDANRIRLCGVKINAYAGDGIHIHNGNGLFLSDFCHLNGTSGNGSKGILADGNWDTIAVTGLLCGQHDNGIRLGGEAGSIANVLLSQVVLDRLAPNGVGLHIEPKGSGSVWKVMTNNLWTAGGHPMLFNSAETIGFVKQIVLGTWLGTESLYGVWTNGAITDLTYEPRVMKLMGGPE